jgi:hypothetical protein
LKNAILWTSKVVGRFFLELGELLSSAKTFLQQYMYFYLEEASVKSQNSSHFGSDEGSKVRGRLPTVWGHRRASSVQLEPASRILLGHSEKMSKKLGAAFDS